MLHSILRFGNVAHTTKTRKTGTEKTYVDHTAVWLDYNASIVVKFHDACYLLITKLITSEYPLLWKLIFIPVFKVGDLDNNAIFHTSQAQKNFIRDSFTFPAKRLNPLIDTHQDASFID